MFWIQAKRFPSRVDNVARRRVHESDGSPIVFRRLPMIWHQ